MNCPRCGRELTIPDAALLDAQTAPWLCVPCHRGYNEHELAHAADYRHATNDWRFGDMDMRQAETEETDAARARGTRVREDRIVHLSNAQVDLLLTRRLSNAYKLSVTKEKRRRLSSVS
jgi:hypothetical protein